LEDTAAEIIEVPAGLAEEAMERAEVFDPSSTPENCKLLLAREL
jgi:hypothetical protein